MNPNPLYRPNADQSIEVFGQINEDLVSRLAPRILALRKENAKHITIYINSIGGEITCLRYIYDLIKQPSPDGHCPHLITVGIGNVGSSAAALLGLGDYSIAYPGANIHFHGARFLDVPEITVESASKIFDQLRAANETMAANLAKGSCERLAFRYWMLTNPNENQTPEGAQRNSVMSIEQFSETIKQELSTAGKRIIRTADNRWKTLRQISEETKKDIDPNLRGIDFEAEILRRIITFEANKAKASGKTTWNVGQVVNDFSLLKQYDTGSHHQFFERIVQRFGDAFFTKAELTEVNTSTPTPETEKAFTQKVQQRIIPFCYFAASICDVLHQQENPLTAEDAYWLGEVDEIYGSELPCLRIVEERSDTEEQSEKKT